MSDLPPELVSAALAEWDPRYARVAAGSVSPDGTAAVLLLFTNEEPTLYPYEVCMVLEDGVWQETVSGNAPGIHWFDSDDPSAPVAESDWDGLAEPVDDPLFRVTWTRTAETPPE